MERNANETNHRPVILPIAGGKGGVGKSVVSANIAAALAQSGCRTVAADLDLGGSNLHSFLGVPNKYQGVGGFIKQERQPLTDFLVPTALESLKFLPGDGITPFMANITFHQKKRLITAIQNLEAEYVILDLGAGTTFNILDFFALSHNGLLIAVPELPSVLSMLAFLKNFIFRYIERAIAGNKSVRERLNHMIHHRESDQQLTVGEIRESIRLIDPEVDAAIEKICTTIRPGIIFNMGSHPDEMELIDRFSRGLKKVLSLEADYLGFIFTDSCVRLALNRHRPLLLEFPESPSAKECTQIARRILKFRTRTIPDSARLLMESTRFFYEKHIKKEE